MLKHFIKYNAIGEPIYYITLEETDLARWQAEETEEHKKLSNWIKLHYEV